MQYYHKARRRVPSRLGWLLVGIVLLVLGGVLLSRHLYYAGLGPVSDSQQAVIFTVKSGDTVKEIAGNLEDKKLIKSAWAMELYVHSKQLSDTLQAGTYSFSPSQGTPAIVKTMTKGKVSTRLVTVLPGRRIDQVRSDLINEGFKPDEVDQALQPGQYQDMPALAFKPDEVNTLEGLLWPDSFQKDPGTPASAIIRQSLQEMGDHLNADVQAAFAAQGLSTYQGVILASIVIQEVDKPTDQAQAAQVFMSRLKAGTPLGSDVTARYGAIAAGKTPNLTYDSPYNTHLHPGLPPAPISSISESSLNAAAHPANTNWLFFVTGDDGTTYFSTNLQDHEALTDKYCHRLCGR
jgi:UPF0755 protein